MPTDLHVVQAVILGVVQGLTEFLPISSSAHLILVRWLLEWNDPGLAFDVALHTGTLLAIVIYFWREWWALALALAKPERAHERRLLICLVLGTVPGAMAGYFGDTWVSQAFHSGGGQWIVGSVMACMGLVLWLSDLVGRKVRSLADLGPLHALLIGVAQALAVIPGISRSGATMTMGLFLGLKREAAARFSFLMAAPIIAGAGLKEGFDLLRAPGPVPWVAVGAGAAASLVVGALAIAFLLKWLAKGTFLPFAIYRLAVGLGVVVLHLAGIR